MVPRQRAASGSLSLYLRGFVHTIAVMQDRGSPRARRARVWRGLARDGVVYAEVRYAPVFHSERGLNLEQVVQSVERGFERRGTRPPHHAPPDHLRHAGPHRFT